MATLLALVLPGSLLVRQRPGGVADAFCASRLDSGPHPSSGASRRDRTPRPWFERAAPPADRPPLTITFANLPTVIGRHRPGWVVPRLVT